MKKKKLSLNKLFQNNKFLIILALVISTITWVYMSMGTTNDTTVTISNIPIQIELPDQLDNNGLQVFRYAEQTATVTVTAAEPFSVLSERRILLSRVLQTELTRQELISFRFQP